MSLKNSLKRALGHLGIYHRLTYSRVYDVYWALTDRRVLTERAREVAFYKRVLAGFRKGNWIFDIGANRGYRAKVESGV
jgi:hypothetical protein